MTTPSMGPVPMPPHQAGQQQPPFPNAQPPHQAPQQQARAGVFDVRFTQFLSLTLISVWWAVALIGIGIAAIIGVIVGFTKMGDSVGTGLAYIFGSLLGAVLLAVVTRLFLESVAVLFRIADNTSEMVRQGR